MKNPYSEPQILSIYPYKSRLKWIVLIFAILISAGSIYYTNMLVEELKETEKRFINLFAKSLENTINDDANLTFITQEIIAPNTTIPVIWVDAENNPIDYRNLDIDSTGGEFSINKQLQEEMNKMKKTYDPIPIQIAEDNKVQYIYYKNSFILTQLTYYPYVQLTVITIFGFIAYLAFSYSKTAEQNRVWVGLAKETAHQLGTPLSSLMAWLEHMKSDPEFKNSEIADELHKDIEKLQLITERFSSIGSEPVLTEENIPEIISKVVNYLQNRLSTKVNIQINAISDNITAKINTPLFEWVIENLCKNAVDAMSGVGKLEIKILRGSDFKVFVDITDNGKGIPKSKIKQVFHPGFTTKKRGWGLGLTLVKRIIEIYHKGRIFVKDSEPDKGTTFRIVLSSKF